MSGTIYLAGNLIQTIVTVFFLEQIGKPKIRYIYTCALWILSIAVIYFLGVIFSLSSNIQSVLRICNSAILITGLYQGNIIKRFLNFVLLLTINTLTEFPILLLCMILFEVPFEDVYIISNNYFFSCAILLVTDLWFIGLLISIIIMKRKQLFIKGNFTQIGIMLTAVLIHFASIIIYYSDKSVLDNMNNHMIQLFFQLLLYVILVFNYFNALRTRKLMESEQALKNLETEMEHNYSYYTLADEKFTEISKLRHDIHNQIQAVQHLLKTGKNKQEADEIMNRIEEQLAAAKTVHFCQNPIINSVLTVKMNTVKANGIETDILLNDCENLPFDNYDICSLFANLYDNAVEACQKIEENKERRITMRSSIKNDYFVLKIVNTCIEMPEIKSGKIKSDKNSDEHGYGTKIIDSITKKYNGTFTLRFKDNLMTAIAALKIE